MGALSRSDRPAYPVAARGGVLFIDAAAEAPYDDETLRTTGLGGTEATVVRVAGGLARDRPVTVAQRRRQDAEVSRDGVAYVPYEHRGTRPATGVDAVVVVRQHKLLPAVREAYPEARLYLWTHCFPGRKRRHLAPLLVEKDCTLLAVSRYHARATRAFLARDHPKAALRARIQVVYNPVCVEAEGLAPAIDPDKLLFLSSPHKGLDEVLAHFQYVRARIPSLHLYVANPGYLHWPTSGSRAGVVDLGTLPHREVMDHLRSSLCLFYPQVSFEETFGLVLAEANAVGTPVLAHPLAATPEVIGGEVRQLVDARSPDAVLAAVQSFRQTRPRAHRKPAFTPEAVLHRWRRLLDEDERSLRPPSRLLREAIGARS